MKYFDYDTYKNNETQGYEYLIDIGDYDIYVNVENQVSTYVNYKTICHENIVGWEKGQVLLSTLSSEEDTNELEHAIRGYNDEIEEPINKDEPEVLTDKEYWKDTIEDLIKLN